MHTPDRFETKRLILKPTTEEDASFIFELFNTPKWLQYIGDRNIGSETEAASYIKSKTMPQFQRLGYGNYIVIRKTDKAKMGTCGLYNRDGVDGIDLGFAFLPRYEGQGYAFEAASEIIRLAFFVFGLDKLSAITAQDNLASQRLLRKLGFTLKGNIKLPKEEAQLMQYQLHKMDSLRANH